MQRDAWESPFRYTVEAGEAILWSKGPDLHGRPGDAPELERRVAIGPPPVSNDIAAPEVRCDVAPPKHIEFDRARVDEVLEDPRQLTSGARIVPAFEEGRAVGFKLLGIRDGSFHREVGLCDGDIVVEINEHPLSSPIEALAAYELVKRSKRARLLIARGATRHVVDIRAK